MELQELGKNLYLIAQELFIFIRKQKLARSKKQT